MTRVPDELVVLYVAFLKNNKMVTWAIEQYYTDVSGVRRARLIQELAKKIRGNSLSYRITRAQRAMPLLDEYNYIFRLTREEEDGIDIDFSEQDILTILNKAGIK